jgi:hypothetical protein
MHGLTLARGGQEVESIRFIEISADPAGAYAVDAVVYRFIIELIRAYRASGDDAAADDLQLRWDARLTR